MQNETLDKPARLAELARDIDNYRRERDWPLKKLAQQISQIGSDRTFTKILDGKFEDLNVDSQLRAYEIAALTVADLRTRDFPAEPIYPGFANVLNVKTAVSRAWNEPSIARTVIVSGENGTGKTTARDQILKDWPKGTVNTQADETWRDSLNTPYLEIIRALNVKRKSENGEPWRIPNYPPDRQEVILDELNKRKLILIIDDAHRMGPRGLNMLITLIDKSLVVPVLFGLPVLLRRLFTTAYEEAIQLTGNRLCERVSLDSPSAGEILDLFTSRGVTFADKPTEADASKRLVGECPDFGNWRFIVKVQRECFRMAGGKPMALDQFNTAFLAARARCVQEQKKG